jgi:hypothetical protein
MLFKARLLLLCGALGALTGCYNITYVARSRTPAAIAHEQKQDFFLWGIVGKQNVDVRALCPTGPAKIKGQQTGVEVLLAIITLGIYTPRSVFVTCGV